MTTPRRTSPATRPSLGLLAAGVLTCGMALYHFWLPSAFHWGDALTQVPMLRWGLFMINASFSYLLLAGGAMTLWAALSPEPGDRTRRLVLVAMGGYWLFNAVYQVLIPMPMPPRLATLRWAFAGFAATLVLLYGFALVRRDARPAMPSRAPDRAPGRTP